MDIKTASALAAERVTQLFNGNLAYGSTILAVIEHTLTEAQAEKEVPSDSQTCGMAANAASSEPATSGLAVDYPSSFEHAGLRYSPSKPASAAEFWAIWAAKKWKRVPDADLYFPRYAIEFAGAYHLQAAPSDWYLWAVAHMTALRNAICATIPEGEPFGDDALVAWPAKLNKKLKNAQAGTGWVLASRAREFTGALSVAVWDESAQEYFHDIGFCDDRGWHRRSERRGTVAYWQQLCPLPPPPEEPRA